MSARYEANLTDLDGGEIGSTAWEKILEITERRLSYNSAIIFANDNHEAMAVAA
jgi:hypothetical protein